MHGVDVRALVLEVYVCMHGIVCLLLMEGADMRDIGGAECMCTHSVCALCVLQDIICTRSASAVVGAS